MRRALVLALAAACASEPASHVCSTGIVCPANLICAAVQPICLSDGCGDGKVEGNEQCDDGNILPGDGCSPTCQMESCGNGVVDPGEICDLGPGRNGHCMGCSADCMSTEACGNGILDPECGEMCDDGNTSNACDGCSMDCKSTQVCGNGITDKECGEICDPPGPGCSNDCRSTNMCGNGTVDIGEECDDGVANNGDDKDCRSDCFLNRCGDGYPATNGINHHEDCDPATPVPAHSDSAMPIETSGCNLDCTAASCGDSKINKARGEQCDNGLSNNDHADCTSMCQVNVCGDGLDDTMGPNHMEACDLGMLNSNTGACKLDCTLPSCGDGYIQSPEQCDDGTGTNADNADCTSLCHVNVCGDGLRDTAGPFYKEDCDNGSSNANNADCTSACKVASCGDGLVDTAGPAKTEVCDLGSFNGMTACPYGQQSCAICTNSCQTAGTATGPYCGDGTTNGPESCDDGPLDGTTTCPYGTATCNICNATCSGTVAATGNVCGDGVLDPGGHEVCDDGNTLGCGTCSSDCKVFASSAATGYIVVVDSTQIVSGMTFTLNDGINPAVVFEYNNGTTTNVQIKYGPSDSANTIANKTANAIAGASNLNITASNSNASVVLQNTHLTILGNVTIQTSANNPETAIGMSGGAGGDCDVGVVCKLGADCKSGSCDTTVNPHVCK